MNLPPYDIFPNISADRISLRQVMLSDMNNIVEISFYDSIPAKTVDEATAILEKINNDYLDGNSIHWGIVETATNKLVGTCGFYRGLNKSEGELGCVLLPPFRGQGFMTKAMELAIDFGLNEIGLKRIWAITTKENFKAIKLLERLQFIKIADLEDDEIEFELTTRKQ